MSLDRLFKRVVVSGGLTLFLVGGAPVQGQVSPAAASLSGELTDTASHLPVRRASVCEQSGHVVNCRQADSLGRFVYGGLSAGEHVLFLSCDNGNRRVLLSSKLLQTLRITLSAGEQRHLHLLVDATGCDQRPFDVKTGEFRGHYSAGFELSTFVPCQGTAGPAAWVEFTDKARHQAYPPWPDVDANESEQRVYIRWIGTIQGPYRYGHMSLASYELRVDSVVEVQPPRADDCRPAGK